MSSEDLGLSQLDVNEVVVVDPVVRNAIINSLSIPSSFDETSKKIKNQVVSDASVLTCGCIISERFAKSLIVPNSSHLEKFNCPLCHSTTKLLSAIEPMRQIFKILGLKDPEFNFVNKRKDSLLSLFYSIATSINEEPVQPSVEQQQPQQQQVFKRSTSIPSIESNHTVPLTTTTLATFMDPHETVTSSSNASISNKSTSILTQPSSASTFTHAQQQTQQQLPPSLHKSSSQLSATKYSNTTDQYKEHKEYLFAKCFPTYRRHFQYQTQKKFFKTKSKIFLNTAISPSCKFFTLLSSKKFEVYKISDESSLYQPELYCVGNNRGEYGLNFENLKKPTTTNDNDDDDDVEIRGGGISPQNDPFETEYKSKLSNFEHLYCSMSDELLVISGTNGIIRVFNLLEFGKPIYIYCSNFPIRCIDISSNSKLIAYGITGKDRINGSEQALIVMHRLFFKNSSSSLLSSSSSSAKIDTTTTTTNPTSNNPNVTSNSKSIVGLKLEKVDPITITFPYSDPINYVSFSQDCNYLSCSTALESRFLTVLVKDPSKPRLIMKSIRTLDTSLESEGITSIKMFPNNKYMIVTSVSFNASPIIIDNNISLINGLQTIAQPKLLLKLDEIGSNIHNSCISPRNDSIVMVDRDGTVYLLFTTKLNQESKRLFILDQVSNAFRARESASLSFSPDGHKIFIVDRKGILYVNDFSAGLPQNPEITRCKVVNTS